MCISQDIIEKRLEYPKTIIFCKSYQDCSSLYLSLVEHLGENKTNSPGYPNLVDYRILSMYTRASTPEMKHTVKSLFSRKDDTLCFIIATTAFSMGIDCPDIHQVIHSGVPSSIDRYIQEIGQAGHDGLQSKAILKIRKISRYTEMLMK